MNNYKLFLFIGKGAYGSAYKSQRKLDGKIITLFQK